MMLEPSSTVFTGQNCARPRKSRFETSKEFRIGIFIWDESLFMVNPGLKGSTAIKKNRKETLKMLSRDIYSSFLIGYRETPKERQRFILWIYVEGNEKCDDFNSNVDSVKRRKGTLKTII